MGDGGHRSRWVRDRAEGLVPLTRLGRLFRRARKRRCLRAALPRRSARCQRKTRCGCTWFRLRNAREALHRHVPPVSSVLLMAAAVPCYSLELCREPNDGVIPVETRSPKPGALQPQSCLLETYGSACFPMEPSITSAAASEGGKTRASKVPVHHSHMLRCAPFTDADACFVSWSSQVCSGPRHHR
jgi:hypothetical protein